MKPTNLNQFHPQSKRRWLEIDWNAFWTVLWLALILLLAYALVAENDAAADGIAAQSAERRASMLLAHCLNSGALLAEGVIIECRTVSTEVAR